MKVYDPDPAINERIRRAVRYGQTRWAEVWLSLAAVGFGLILLYPEPTFAMPNFRIIALFVTEREGGAASLAFGLIRLGALWVNGRRGRETSLIRTLGCIGGFFFWGAIALGFLLAMPPLSTGVAIYAVFAAAELHSSGKAASDMAAEDTFGFRKRRRVVGRHPRLS